MEPVTQLIEADIASAHAPGTLPLIKKVDWTITRGDFWVVGAPPGAGKTDLLCTVAGLQRPSNGQHLLFGRKIEELSEDELVEMRLRVAMIFTTGRLFNGMTIEQNIALPLAYHHSYREEELAQHVSDALSKTGLAAWAKRRPDQVTRNLHQRIGLARALALNPEVLLIDNPLSSVDPRQGRWWLDFLCELQKSATIVVATDDFRPWTDVGSHFALLKDNRLEAVGGREDVRKSEDVLVRELLTSAFDSL
ncbi:MAG TPA: ATP-binding cassette domain-containing protein [Verrucomicrobiae bacterium]